MKTIRATLPIITINILALTPMNAFYLFMSLQGKTTKKSTTCTTLPNISLLNAHWEK